MQQARATLEDARIRWSVASPNDRALWAIKWAAERATHSITEGNANRQPIVERGDIEYVWVQPLTWSPFRIEAILISEPTSPLQCSRVAGEMVSFPIEEAADWIHFASDAPDAPFEGGYTVRVLEDHYGKPGR